MADTPGLLIEVVESSDVPLGVVDLQSGEMLVANDALAGLLGVKLEALVGSMAVSFVVPEQRPQAESALRALADRTLTGYQAVRSFRANGAGVQELTLCVSALEVDDRLVGLASYEPLYGGRVPSRAIPSVLDARSPGNVVLGTVDGEWRINRVSYDVQDMLGFAPEELIGSPVLGQLHPLDAPSFLAAVEYASAGGRTMRVAGRLRTKSGDWTLATAVLATLTDDHPPALAFAFVMCASDDAVAVGSDVAQRSLLEGNLLRIARELRASGTVSHMGDLPDPVRFSALSRLTTREWEILVRLLDGERVPSIAADLFVSQSTIRNHLSSIFAKLGVHSQAELIRLLRSA